MIYEDSCGESTAYSDEEQENNREEELFLIHLGGDCIVAAAAFQVGVDWDRRSRMQKTSEQATEPRHRRHRRPSMIYGARFP